MEIDLSSFERSIQKEKLMSVLSENIELMKWFNNKSIFKHKVTKIKIKELIKEFVYNNIKELKTYGKSRKIYNCPLVGKNRYVSLHNCKRCRYLAFEKENIEVDDWENRTFYENISISCIGHVSSQFDTILKENGAQINTNKAFEK